MSQASSDFERAGSREAQAAATGISTGVTS